jgi:hypothetical protein
MECLLTMPYRYRWIEDFAETEPIYFLWGLLVAVPLGIAIYGLKCWHTQRFKQKEQEMNKYNFTIRHSAATRWVSIILSIIFIPAGCVLFFATFRPEHAEWDWIGPAASFPFFIIGITVLFQTLLWKLEVTGDTISITNLFGRTNTYAFSEITKVKRKNYITRFGNPRKATAAYAKKRRLFVVEDDQAGYDLLIKRLQKSPVPGNRKRGLF